MALSPADRDFLASTNSAAMITVGPGGVPKVAKVGVAVVDGKIWVSGTADRVRTRRLRDDPRCTLYVHDNGYGWLALETRVTILDGPDVPEQSVRFFRIMQGKPEGPLSWFGGELDEESFRATMVAEQRILYEFEVDKAYGMHGPLPS
jgi:PPOX class probable F420-dependent enzyme